MISYIFFHKNDCELSEKTINCIFENWNRNKDEIIICSMSSDKEFCRFINQYKKQRGYNIILLNTVCLHLKDMINNALSCAKGDYIIFLEDGDVLSGKYLSETFNNMKANKSKEKIFAFYTKNKECKVPNKECKVPMDIFPKCMVKRSKDFLIALKDYPTCVPTSLFGYVFNRQALDEAGMHTEDESGLDLIYKILLKYPKILFLTEFEYTSWNKPEELCSSSLVIMDKSWYFEVFNNVFKDLFDQFKQENKRAPDFLQYAVLYQIKWRFMNNLNNSNKHVIDNELDDFFALIKVMLDMVSTEVLVDTVASPKYNLNTSLRFALLYLKNNGTLDKSFIKGSNTLYLVHNQCIIANLANQKICIDLIDYVDSKLIIEASTDSFSGFENINISATMNYEPIQMEETSRYAHTKYFGISTHKKYTFRLTIPACDLLNTKSIAFYMNYGYMNLPLKIVANRYTARVNSKVRSAYWIFNNNYMLKYKNKSTRIVIEKASRSQRMIQELKMLKGMLFGCKRYPKMFVLRCIFWASYPFLKSKNIWLTYDKLYKGGDCGEYLYKYMCTRKDKIVPAYVINSSSPDFKRLRQEGYHPLKYGSLKHRLYYLHSSVVFTTHGGVYSFNAFSNKQISYFQDLLHHDVACIQHGLTVQQLAFNSNRTFNNMKRYYCASKYEIQNLSHPVYGYEDKSILKLTGIPRYDGLVNRDQKQILITPTWRNYIAMPAASKNSAKPYNPDFIKTDYYKLYNALLSDKKLIEMAKKTGYKLVYLLHPVISAQINDYPKSDEVEILPALDINYEKILTESSLMLTDYSGVQFDFAYMRKPVLYYHHPKLPPHYKEGGFFYDTMGFGEICTDHKTLVDTLCEYMVNDCEVKPFYLERQDDFFAFNDLNNCSRIYDDMFEYQRTLGKLQ